MTTQPQPEALRLAGALLEPVVLDKHAMQAAAELRRLHAECEALRHNNRVLTDAIWKACGDDGEVVDATIESQGTLIDAARAAKEQSNG